MAFEKLVKEIDVLTYNARSVLNALNRSVLKYGTSNGYSVTRAGVELVLEREDIYLLYRFYNEWGVTKYAKDSFQTAFDSVTEHFMSVVDVKLDKLRNALVKHSKIMFMTKDNKNDSEDEWINRIIDYVDKHVLVNSSPIPVNLRTPVFDENMATTKYNQFETYLLPIGYYMQAILGYSGDNEDHSAGGKTWTFNVDRKFTVKCPTIELGGDNGSERYTYRISSAYGSSIYTSYSLVYGYNTKVNADTSTAGGSNSFVIGGRSAHNISDCSMIQGSYSGIYAGINNQIYAYNGAIAGGEDLVITGTHGFAANRLNTVGFYGMVYDIPDLSTVDNSCEVVVNVCDAATNAIKVTHNPRNVVRLYVEKNRSYPIQYNVFNPGDKVLIYNQTKNGKNYLTWNGIECKSQVATISSISYHNTNDGGYVDIFLEQNVDYSQYGFDGGRIAPYASKAHPSNYYGTNSTALNYMTTAAGYNQTVVGIANIPYTSPRFIVGCGYIPAGNALACRYIDGGYVASTVYRENNFMVADDFIYAGLGSYIGFGISRNSSRRREFGRWVDTTDLKNQPEIHLEVTEGAVEPAFNESYEQNPDTTDYNCYHTNHIGLSATKMSMGRYSNRNEKDNIIAAVNFYDKDWFNDHKDVNNMNQPRNTALELIAQNGVRELKTNMNITNGFVTADGYICTYRYATEGSYGVWLDNPVSSSLYSNSEYIAVSAANTLSLYSANCVKLTSKSTLSFMGKYLYIDKNTETIGTLALTGDAKSHSHWFDGDVARSLYGGFLLVTKGKVQAMAAKYILPNYHSCCWGLDEFVDGDPTSAHIFSSVGGANNITDYDNGCNEESTKLVLPGPSYTNHIHPFLIRYKKQLTDAQGKVTTKEIMQVDKLAFLEDISNRTVYYAYNNEGLSKFVKVCTITLSALTAYASAHIILDFNWFATTGNYKFNSSRLSIGFRGDWNSPKHDEWGNNNKKPPQNCSAACNVSVIRTGGSDEAFPIFLVEDQKASATYNDANQNISATNAQYSIYAWIPAWSRGFSVKLVDAPDSSGRGVYEDCFSFMNSVPNLYSKYYNTSTVIAAKDVSVSSFNSGTFSFDNGAGFAITAKDNRIYEGHVYHSSFSYSDRAQHNFSLNGNWDSSSGDSYTFCQKAFEATANYTAY